MTYEEVSETIYYLIADALKYSTNNQCKVTVQDIAVRRITQEDYDKLSTRYRTEQKNYTEKLSRLRNADEQYYITVSYLLELASRSYELFTGSEPVEKRELIQLVFQNLWMKDGKLEYVMHKPFDSIFKTANSLAWGG